MPKMTVFMSISTNAALQRSRIFTHSQYNRVRFEHGPGRRGDLARNSRHSDTKRVLLINPAIYDIRLPWAKWQLPVTSLKLGDKLLKDGADVRLVDFIHEPQRGKARKLIGHAEADGTNIQKWRYGKPRNQITSQLKAWSNESWHPDEVYVEGFTTFWWEGVQEAVSIAKSVYPKAQVTAIGPYAELMPSHATEVSGADAAQTKDELSIRGHQSSLQLYEDMPTCWHLMLPRKTSGNAELLEYAKRAQAKGVEEFSLLHDELTNSMAQVLLDLMEKSASQNSRVRLNALGSIGARDVAEMPLLAGCLRSGGFKHIFLADDRTYKQSQADEDRFIEENKLAIEACHKAGFKPRTDAIVAGLCIGRKGETIERRTHMAAHLASIVGSVIPWPYQPALSETATGSPEEHNSKLYPLRAQNGLTYLDYAELVSLAAVLNSRYRDCSFDFLGNGLIPSLLASSIERQGWNPDPCVKGPLVLPMRVTA